MLTSAGTATPITLRFRLHSMGAHAASVTSVSSELQLLADNGNPARATVSVPAINEHRGRSQKSPGHGNPGHWTSNQDKAQLDGPS